LLLLNLWLGLQALWPEFMLVIAGAAGVVTAAFVVEIAGSVAVIFGIIPFLRKSVRSLLIHVFSYSYYFLHAELAFYEK
jgi:hypothetical protein